MTTFLRIEGRGCDRNERSTGWRPQAAVDRADGSCTGACLGVWPVLLMPRGKGRSMPVGAPCLGKAPFGHRWQVTYRNQRLYQFAGDSGSSVNGNNVGGFKVAKLVARSCPRK